MNNPSVSVIIPVYNRAQLLLEASVSVIAQKYRDFELIVVDDCSDDLPEKALTCLPGIEEITLKYIRLDRHFGMPGFVRNRGVEAASGEYIAFLDSDDIWMPEKLEKQADVILRGRRETAAEESGLPYDAAAFAETSSAGRIKICHTREKWLRDSKVVSQSSQRHKREGDIFEDSLWKCIIGPSTVMMEKSLFESIGGFREDLEIAEDYELWLKVTAENPVSYIDEPLTVKRAGEWDQLSARYGQIEIFRIKALQGLLKSCFFTSLDNPEREKSARQVFEKKCLIYASGCRKRGRIEEALYYENLCG